jgi:glycosyltransferase involved in cell wall biosynthesis
MKVAIVHYWLVGMRGGERVLEAICKMFPQADIYTHVAAPDQLSDVILRHRIYETFIARLPFARTWYPRYLPLMPLALESLDLTSYDLIISCEAGPAKGIIPGPSAVHITYCHSPMRYIWDQQHVYKKIGGIINRILMPIPAHYLRIWDATSAMRVDHFVSNSRHVANRIKKYYRRAADVVYPPVAVDEFAPVPYNELGSYYLWCGELVSYKRPDIAIEAFNSNGLPLIVIGDGKERKRLQKLAKPNIIFMGKVSFNILKHHMARCKALVFPGEEDFGIIPVEVQASGRPVIALAKGGALETVIDGITGLFFDEPTAQSLEDAIRTFEASKLAFSCASDCRANAEQFREDVFVTGLTTVLKTLGISVPTEHVAGQIASTKALV